jgi:hypothetical protein
VASIAFACNARKVLLALAGEQFAEQALEPVDGLGPKMGQLVAAVGEHLQRLELTVRGVYP